MSYVDETETQRSTRLRKAWLAVILSFVWWIVSIGGIIYVINTST